MRCARANSVLAAVVPDRRREQAPEPVRVRPTAEVIRLGQRNEFIQCRERRAEIACPCAERLPSPEPIRPERTGRPIYRRARPTPRVSRVRLRTLPCDASTRARAF